MTFGRLGGLPFGLCFVNFFSCKVFRRDAYSLDFSSDLSYNYGNVLYRGEQLDKSLEAYKNTVLRNPNDSDARKNYEFVKNKIKKNKRGFYFHLKFEGNGNTVKELEKAENIDETLFRFLTVKVKKHDLATNYFEKKEFQKVLEKNEKK